MPSIMKCLTPKCPCLSMWPVKLVSIYNCRYATIWHNTVSIKPPGWVTWILPPGDTQCTNCKHHFHLRKYLFAFYILVDLGSCWMTGTIAYECLESSTDCVCMMFCTHHHYYRGVILSVSQGLFSWWKEQDDGFKPLLLKCLRGHEEVFFIYEIQLQFLTPWNRVHLEKLTVAQLVKKFPTFYRIRWFITVFTRAHKFRGPV
jgi:hypothetical protein